MNFVDLAQQGGSVKWPMNGQECFLRKGAIDRRDGVISVRDVGAVHVSMAVYSV